MLKKGLSAWANLVPKGNALSWISKPAIRFTFNTTKYCILTNYLHTLLPLLKYVNKPLLFMRWLTRLYRIWNCFSFWEQQVFLFRWKTQQGTLVSQNRINFSEAASFRWRGRKIISIALCKTFSMLSLNVVWTLSNTNFGWKERNKNKIVKFLLQYIVSYHKFNNSALKAQREILSVSLLFSLFPKWCNFV